MKKLLIGIMLGSLLVAGPAAAQCNSDPNEIGIFWSEDCGDCQNCLNSVGVVVSAYVVLANASADSISGFEFSLVNGDGSPLSAPPSTFMLGYELPAGSLNIGTGANFIVGLATPQPWAPCITLLRMELFPAAAEPWCFGVAPAAPASLAGAMAYADGADPGLLIPMRRNTGNDPGTFAMACLNDPGCPLPVAVERNSWGRVKSLYR